MPMWVDMLFMSCGYLQALPNQISFINSLRIKQATLSLGQDHMSKNVLVLCIHGFIVLCLIMENLLRALRALKEVCYLFASSMASWYHPVFCKVTTHSSKLV